MANLAWLVRQYPAPHDTTAQYADGTGITRLRETYT